MDNCITRLTIGESHWGSKEREKNYELQEELLITEVEYFKETVETRRATTELCHKIITKLVEIATSREENQDDAGNKVSSKNLDDE